MDKEQFDNLEDSLNDLNLDNQVKKLKLETEFGGRFVKTASDLDPNLEGAFLDSVLEFEKNFKNSTTTTIYEYLYKPDFQPVAELSDERISEELEKVIQLMDASNIRLDTLCPVDNRTLYTFIVEELFLEEIDDMRIPEMRTYYIYEEFHPNHEYDIRNHCKDFIREYLNKSSDYYCNFLTSAARKQNWHTAFRELFIGFTLNKFDITSIAFADDCGVATFWCDFDGRIDGSRESVNMCGKGEIMMANEYDYWCIDSIIWPETKQI